MMYYIVYIMQGAGLGNELLTSSIQYIINVAMTLPAIIWLDRTGRRPALLLGSFGMMTFLFISGALQAVYGQPNTNPENKSSISWVISGHPSVSKGVVVCSYLVVATFATTWGPTSWTYPSEIFPAKVRAKAVSLATASNWAWNCVLAFAVPPLLQKINWKMYMIFATFNGLALIHVSSFPHSNAQKVSSIVRVSCANRVLLRRCSSPHPRPKARRSRRWTRSSTEAFQLGRLFPRARVLINYRRISRRVVSKSRPMCTPRTLSIRFERMLLQRLFERTALIEQMINGGMADHIGAVLGTTFSFLSMMACRLAMASVCGMVVRHSSRIPSGQDRSGCI
jgi:MFS family permease